MFYKSKKVVSLSLAVALITTSISGCSSNTETDSKNVPKQEQQESKTRIIKDMAGREVEVPKEIKKAHPAFYIANVAMYTINPNKMAGKTFDVKESERKYLKEEYSNLPTLGTFMHGKDGNEEEILKVNPDAIIYMGNLNENLIKEADENQEKLGIPIILVDGRLQSIPESYKFLGELLNEKERGEELAQYCKKVLDETKDIASKIPEEKRVKVYCALGQDGLTTDPSGSIHAEIIDLVGGINAADVKSKENYDRTEVSPEQILAWNPEKIILHKQESLDNQGEESLYEKLLKDSRWSSIKAIKENQVYEIPCLPFNWYDMPPSVNRIMGIKWLDNLLYPEEFKYDIKAETKEFYEKFYDYKLIDKNLDEILKNSISK
ncbi:ABC transporter periplasmic binding protein [Gottschalkia acidurici 9a]|uniref:ABC transporter periplasmic binding protein n=1 Tax=Gottschalkia acidurici (strain ATCC 7906 / DSM 604 / BCRC 14475 / CIP 104303 / KCTC 5404 / NCIMB 10678 / 9a) TaxID=1128398 RepID=K0B1I3_GOTA9|nr:ABC transporter substrate-binding protein [Gottschalkia acidurici]AFS78927.1 ABC transporter periplasmic binding protein [Gottschalkia acidurici 9a]